MAGRRTAALGAAGLAGAVALAGLVVGPVPSRPGAEPAPARAARRAAPCRIVAHDGDHATAAERRLLGDADFEPAAGSGPGSWWSENGDGPRLGWSRQEDGTVYTSARCAMTGPTYDGPADVTCAELAGRVMQYRRSVSTANRVGQPVPCP